MHEFGHFLAAKKVGMKVERFSLFFPPLLLKHKRGETEYAVGAIPLGGYVKITGMNPAEELTDDERERSYYGQPVWKRVVVIAAGPTMNLLIALILFMGLNLFAAKKNTSVVDETMAKSPAAKVLKPGDKIVEVDGERGSVLAFRDRILAHKCAGKTKSGCSAKTPVHLLIERNGRTTEVSVRPRYDTSVRPHGMRIGITYKRVGAGWGPQKAFTESLDTTWLVTERTFTVLAKLFESKQRKQISGLVGGYKITQESFSFNIVNAIFVLAVISLSLAIINLFPFLPLDGGHIFFSLAEKVRGKPISFDTMQRASVIGFMLVIFLFVIGLTNDIGRLTGEGFDVR